MRIPALRDDVDQRLVELGLDLTTH